MDMSSMAMSMTTSTSDMAATMTGMSMSTSTSGMDMSSSSSMTMDMSTMVMTFFTSTTTTLFSTTWTPNNSGQYAGTCIFLIVLAALFRALIAIRLNLFVILAWAKGRGHGEEDELYGMKVEEERRPWRADEAVCIASCDVVLAGVSYMLMIAVMTMNVGYFMSVLGGVFLGSLIFGRFMAKSAAH